MTDAPPPSHTDHEPLCADVPIGRVMHRSILPDGMPLDVEHYLSVDVDFYWRDAGYWGDSFAAGNVPFRLRGPILELSIQVRVRPLAPWCEVARFDELRQLGDPAGPWPLDRFRVDPAVQLGDIIRLAELARYNRNLKADAPTEATLIPRPQVREIRAIVERLTKAGG